MSRLLLVFPTILLSALAFAGDIQVGDLRIDHAWARATMPAQPSGAAYLRIENQGKQAERLLAASSPVAASAEIHTMSMDGNVMKMREVAAIDLAPSTKVAMRPGHGYHIMLMGLKKPLKAGDKFPLTLTFQQRGKVDITVSVEDKTGGKEHAAAPHKH